MIHYRGDLPRFTVRISARKHRRNDQPGNQLDGIFLDRGGNHDLYGIGSVALGSPPA
jgi:hypothetical protein